HLFLHTPVFSSISRRHPASPLFPYTTLFRSLDVVRGRRQHPRDQDLIVRDARVLEDRPLMRVARVGRLEQESLGLGLEHDRQQRSEEHTSELQSRFDLVCRLLLEKKKVIQYR